MGFTDKGSNDKGSNDTGSKARQRVKRHRVKKWKGEIFFILTTVTVSIYLLLFRVRSRHFLGRALRPRVSLVKTLSGPSAAATWSIISMSNI